jgi:hypothetical protein
MVSSSAESRLYRVVSLLVAVSLALTQLGGVSADAAATTVQSSYICGHLETDYYDSGFSSYMYTVLVTCATERILVAGCGPLGGMGGGFARIYDPVLEPTEFELRGGTVYTELTGCSSIEPIADCSQCDMLPPTPPPPTIDFRVDRDTIQRGECTTLRWDVENVQAVFLDGQAVTGHETREICPLTTTTYTLRVDTGMGEEFRTVTVTVTEPPPTDTPTSTATPTVAPPTAAPPTLTASPPPTVTPEPPTPLPPTPSPSPDVQEARQWLDEKSNLIPQMESLDIPTNLFVVPGVHAYDETAARDLLSRAGTQLQQGTLTPEQVQALARLTLQEQALARILPEYTAVAASVADTWADTIETSLGVIFALRPAWNICRQGLPLCGRLQESTERTVWRLVRDSGKMAARWSGLEPDQREVAAKAWDLIARLAQDGLANGKSLRDLLVDNAVQAAGTVVLIQPYLARTQGLLDRGVRTADLGQAAGDSWAITGNNARAKSMTDELVQKAAWRAQDALERHRDYQKAVDLAQVAEDLADMATLSPWGLMAKAVGLGARIEHLFVNLPLIIQNSMDAGCVEYLSTRAAEMAFDSAQPSDDCRYQGRRLPSEQGQIIYAAFRPAPASHALQVALQSQADPYSQALDALIQATQAQDDQAIEQAVSQLSQAETALADTLNQMQAIVLEKKTLADSDLALFEQKEAWSLRILDLYLSVAENVMARQSGALPQADVQQAAQAARAQLAEVQQAMLQVNLALPAGRPVLLVRDVQARAPAEQVLHLEVVVSNVGNAQAEGVEVSLWAGDTSVAEPVLLGALPAGEERRATFTASGPALSLLVVHVRSQGAFLDSFVFEVPDSVAVVQAQPAAAEPAVPEPALPSARTGSGSTGLAIILGVVVLGALSGGGLWFTRQSRRAGGLAPTTAILTVGTQRFAIPAAGADIGRSSECLICLADPQVSRRHARLDWNAGAWVITDLGSTNGTYVNGRRVPKQALRRGDEIRVGSTLLRFGQ